MRLSASSLYRPQEWLSISLQVCWYPRRVPAQPAEGLRSQRCNVHVPAPWHNALLAPHREQEPFPCLYTAALIKKGPMAIMASTMDLTSQSTSDVLVLGLRPPATVMSLKPHNNSIAI